MDSDQISEFVRQCIEDISKSIERIIDKSFDKLQKELTADLSKIIRMKFEEGETEGTAFDDDEESSRNEHLEGEDSHENSEAQLLGEIHNEYATSSLKSLAPVPRSYSLAVNPTKHSIIADPFFKLRGEVVGANIVKSGSKTFDVYPIPVTELKDSSVYIKRRFGLINLLNETQVFDKMPRQEYEEQFCYVKGDDSVHYDHHDGIATFAIDPGGNRAGKYESWLFSSFSFENNIKQLIKSSFGFLRGIQWDPGVQPFRKLLVGTMVLKNKKVLSFLTCYYSLCTKGVECWEWSELDLITLVPWQNAIEFMKTLVEIWKFLKSFKLTGHVMTFMYSVINHLHAKNINDNGESIYRWFWTSSNGIHDETGGVTSSSYILYVDDIGFFVSAFCHSIRSDWFRGPVIVFGQVGLIVSGPPMCHSLEFREAFGQEEKLHVGEYSVLTFDEVGNYVELVYTSIRVSGLRCWPKMVTSTLVAPSEPRGVELATPCCCKGQEVVLETTFFGKRERAGKYIWFRKRDKPNEPGWTKLSNNYDNVDICGKALTYALCLEYVGTYLALYWLPTLSNEKHGTLVISIYDSPGVLALPIVSNVHVKKLCLSTYSGEGEYFGDHEGVSLFSWYRESDDGSMVLIGGTNSKTYEVLEQESNCRLLHVLHVDEKRLLEVRRVYDDYFANKCDGFSFRENYLKYKFDFKTISEYVGYKKGFENSPTKATTLEELSPEIQDIGLQSDPYGAKGVLCVVCCIAREIYGTRCIFYVCTLLATCIIWTRNFSGRPFGNLG